MTILPKCPPPLKPGDKLCVVAPSGALRELMAFEQGVDIWRSWGYCVEMIAGFDRCWGYLAGQDDHRRQQLLTALNDPDCRGILCARGGFGGTRLLEEWQWPKTEPKWLVGFSDITSLLWSYLKQGILGIHGPLLTTLVHEPSWSQQRLHNLVTGKPVASLTGKGWGGGIAKGVLLPANLTVATHLLGTSHEPDFDNVILAFEDVTEAPYRIDRMLTHWRMQGKLNRIQGIALGRFSRCHPPDNRSSFSVEEVLCDRISDLGIPVVSQLPFGHDGVNAALPVGLMAQLDANQGSLSLLWQTAGDTAMAPDTCPN